MKVNYIPITWTLHKNEGYNPTPRTASGYGSKLPTEYVVHDGTRVRRVYAICWSNVASHYILVKGAAYYIPDYRFETAGRIYKNF